MGTIKRLYLRPKRAGTFDLNGSRAKLNERGDAPPMCIGRPTWRLLAQLSAPLQVSIWPIFFESCPCRLAFIVGSSARAARASKMYCATSTLLSVTSDDTDEWTTVPCSTEAQAIVRMYEFLMLLQRSRTSASVYVGDLPTMETQVGEATLYTAMHASIKPQTIYLDDLDPEDVRELKALEAALRRKKRRGVRKL